MSHSNSYAVQIARYQSDPPGPTILDGYSLLEEQERQARFNQLLKHEKAKELAIMLAEQQDERSAELLEAAEESIKELRRNHESRIALADADRMAASVLTAVGAKPHEGEGDGENEKVSGNNIIEGLEDISSDIMGDIGGHFGRQGESIGAGAGAGAVAGATLPILIGSGLSLGGRITSDALLGAGTNVPQRFFANQASPLAGQFARNVRRQLPGLTAKGALLGAGAGAGIQILRNEINKRSSRTLDASLVGYDSPDGIREVFLEKRTPKPREAFFRGAMGAGGGIGIGAGLGWLANARKPSAPILGAILGAITGGGIGASIPVRQGFDPDYGTQVSQREERRAAEVLRRLRPGDAVNNLAVSEPGQEFAPRVFGGEPPSFAYAADIDDMARENPNDAISMLKGASDRTAEAVAGLGAGAAGGAALAKGLGVTGDELRAMLGGLAVGPPKRGVLNSAARGAAGYGGLGALVGAGAGGAVAGLPGAAVGSAALGTKLVPYGAAVEGAEAWLHKNLWRRAMRSARRAGGVAAGAVGAGTLGALLARHLKGNDGSPQKESSSLMTALGIAGGAAAPSFNEEGEVSPLRTAGHFGAVGAVGGGLLGGVGAGGAAEMAALREGEETLRMLLQRGKLPALKGRLGMMGALGGIGGTMGATAFGGTMAVEGGIGALIRKHFGHEAPPKVSKAREYTHNLTTRGTRSVTEKQKREAKAAGEKKPSEEDTGRRAAYSHRKIVDAKKVSFSVPGEPPSRTDRRVAVTQARKWGTTEEPRRSGKPKRPTSNVDHTELQPEKVGGLRDHHRLQYTDADNSEVSADVSVPSTAGKRLPAALGVAGGIAGGAGGFTAASLQNAADTILHGWNPFANPGGRLRKWGLVGAGAGAAAGGLLGLVGKPRGTKVRGFEGASPEEVRELAHIYGVSDEGSLRTMPAFESRFGYLPRDLQVGKM